jgi:hypothetical protein
VALKAIDQDESPIGKTQREKCSSGHQGKKQQREVGGRNDEGTSRDD